MEEGHEESEWARTAQVTAIVFNMMRSGEEPARTPDAFNPTVVPDWVPLQMSDADYRARVAAQLRK